MCDGQEKSIRDKVLEAAREFGKAALADDRCADTEGCDGCEYDTAPGGRCKLNDALRKLTLKLHQTCRAYAKSYERPVTGD